MTEHNPIDEFILGRFQPKCFFILHLDGRDRTIDINNISRGVKYDGYVIHMGMKYACKNQWKCAKVFHYPYFHFLKDKQILGGEDCNVPIFYSTMESLLGHYTPIFHSGKLIIIYSYLIKLNKIMVEEWTIIL